MVRGLNSLVRVICAVPRSPGACSKLENGCGWTRRKRGSLCRGASSSAPGRLVSVSLQYGSGFLPVYARDWSSQDLHRRDLPPSSSKPILPPPVNEAVKAIPALADLLECGRQRCIIRNAVFTLDEAYGIHLWHLRGILDAILVNASPAIAAASQVHISGASLGLAWFGHVGPHCFSGFFSAQQQPF